MAATARLVVTAAIAAGVCVAGALVWKAYGPAAPAVAATEAPPEDTGPHLDLEQLTDRDFAFLARTLSEGTRAARRSAAKALLLAERLEGAPLLFDAAERGGEDALTLCLAGLEILRVQRAEQALRELLLALRQRPGLPEGCRVEVADRFGLVSRGQLTAVLALAADPEPMIRAWVAETAAQQAPEAAWPVLLALAVDAEVEVRRSAWLGLQGGVQDPTDPALVAAAAAESDPRNRALIEELGL